MSTVTTPELVLQQMTVASKGPTVQGFTLDAKHGDTYDFIDPIQNDMRGRSVLITGASKGIGRAAAISYAKAGVSNIAIIARSSMDDVKRDIVMAAEAVGYLAPKVFAFPLDITSQESVEEAATELSRSISHLDILINNAGRLEAYAPLMQVKPHDWWRTWEVNILGTFLVTRSFIPLLLNTPTSLKTVINITSILSRTTFAEGSAYQCSKFAHLRLAELLNSNFPPSESGANKGLLSYSVHPGAIMTELSSGTNDLIHPYLTNSVDLPADTLVWLTKERRDWLKGRYVSVNWDMSELEAMKECITESDLLKGIVAV